MTLRVTRQKVSTHAVLWYFLWLICGLISMPVVSVLRESPVVCVCVCVSSLRLPCNDIHSPGGHAYLWLRHFVVV